MTRIVFFTRGRRLYGFTARGHAGAGERGEDIVCSAISALTQTAATGLIACAGAQALLRRDDEKGLLRFLCSARMTREARERVDLVLRVARHGLEEIEAQFPAFLRVTTRKRGFSE